MGTGESQRVKSTAAAGGKGRLPMLFGSRPQPMTGAATSSCSRALISFAPRSSSCTAASLPSMKTAGGGGGEGGGCGGGSRTALQAAGPGGGAHRHAFAQHSVGRVVVDEQRVRRHRPGLTEGLAKRVALWGRRGRRAELGGVSLRPNRLCDARGLFIRRDERVHEVDGAGAVAAAARAALQGRGQARSKPVALTRRPPASARAPRSPSACTTRVC